MNNNKKYARNIVSWFKKYRWVFILALAVALAAGIFSRLNAGRFSVSGSIDISRRNSQSAIDYKYDNYYALRATDEFGDTVAGWFKTPELARAVARKIGAQADAVKPEGRYRAVKISPNTVEVLFSVDNETAAAAVNEAIGEFLQKKVDSLNSISGQGISFSISLGEPVVTENIFGSWLAAAAGFIVGLVAGFFILAAKEYFK